jgi:hypothetical protein
MPKIDSRKKLVYNVNRALKDLKTASEHLTRNEWRMVMRKLQEVGPSSIPQPPTTRSEKWMQAVKESRRIFARLRRDRNEGDIRSFLVSNPPDLKTLFPDREVGNGSVIFRNEKDKIAVEMRRINFVRAQNMTAEDHLYELKFVMDEGADTPFVYTLDVFLEMVLADIYGHLQATLDPKLHAVHYTAIFQTGDFQLTCGAYGVS